MPSEMNLALMKVVRRADQQDQAMLVSTFVDVGPLFALLNSRDHQVVFGRRGTGKTHALRYLKQTKDSTNDIALFIDLRTIGSNASIYSDKEISIQERATRLLIDCFDHIFNSLFDVAVETGASEERILALFETLRGQISMLRVVGTIAKETQRATSAESGTSSSMKFGFTRNNFSTSIESAESAKGTKCDTETIRESGHYESRVSFGGLSTSLRDILNVLPQKTVWLLLDEWSTIPLELQPYLADLLRRAIFPLDNFTVKIGAIETRCNMHIAKDDYEYIGIELGADAQADINLDDFMVFGNDSTKAETFFCELLRKHAESYIDSNVDVSDGGKFISNCFTQRTPFTELVKASEGVPRDAINIAALAAQKADDAKISVNDVRSSSKTWYDRDKSRNLSAEANELLMWLVDNVISTKRSRSFLLEHDKYSSHRLIRHLVDARVLHVLKRGYSAQDIPGVRFDVYGIDYGCYVDLLATLRSPNSDVVESIAGDIVVPDDDYRSIRRAILNLDDFFARSTTRDTH